MRPPQSPLPVETIVILSTLASGDGESPHDLRHIGDQLVDHRGLVVFLVGFGLHVHGLGFGLAFLEDDLGFGFALRADGGRRPSASAIQRAFRLRQRFDALALHFGLLQHGGDQFFLAALDFRLLHLDLRFSSPLAGLDRLPRPPAAA